MNRINQIISVVFCLIGVVIIVISPHAVTAGSVSAAQLAPDFFPKFIGWFVVVCSIAQFIQSTVQIKLRVEVEEKEPREIKREGKVLLIFVMILAYIAVSKVIGFFLASAIFVCAFLAVLNVKKWWYYVIAVILSFVAFYCFRYLLFVRLPLLGIWII